MDKHALSVLADAESWEWPAARRIMETEKQGGHCEAITPKLLSWLIQESQRFGGTILDQFWEQIRQCHPKLKENVDNLSRSPLAVPSSQSSMVLFQGIDRKDVDFKPVFDMAAEYFTHLGIAFMNPGGRKSGGGTPHSVSDIVNMETDELLAVAAGAGFGVRKQVALKSLAFKRDGYTCALTGVRFNSAPGGDYCNPILAHVIPNSVHGKPDTLRCIAMFVGNEARDLIIQHLNGIRNVVNIQWDAHDAYHNLKWGIEAQNDNGTVKYVYRRVPFDPDIGPASIRLRDGDRIEFGQGTEGSRLGVGPLPLLCNLRLAVARVLKMSGAADIIAQLMEDADDSDFPHSFIASEDFYDILDAKLLLKRYLCVVPVCSTPLALASSAGKVEVGRFLIHRGADLSMRDNQSQAPLHLASQHGHLDMARLLLDHGVDPNIKRNDLWSPLHPASANDHLKIAELLVQRGASVDVSNDEQKTPLYRAVTNGNTAIARLLIEHRATGHTADSNGWTLLHTASRRGHLEVVKLLLRRGADVEVLSKAGRSAAELASENGQAKVAKFISEYKVDADTRNKLRSTTLDTAEYGADDDGKVEAEVSLRAAAEEGNIDTVKSLLERGVDINARNASNQTPLDRAAVKGNFSHRDRIRGHATQADSPVANGRPLTGFGRARGCVSGSLMRAFAGSKPLQTAPLTASAPAHTGVQTLIWGVQAQTCSVGVCSEVLVAG